MFSERPEEVKNRGWIQFNTRVSGAMWAKDECFRSFTLAEFQGCFTSGRLSLGWRAAGQKTCRALPRVMEPLLGGTDRALPVANSATQGKSHHHGLEIIQQCLGTVDGVCPRN